MSDDFSISSRIMKSIQKTRKGLAINQVIIGILLLISHSIFIASDPSSEFAKNFVNFVNGVTYYAVISLIAMAYILINKPFVTPEVKSPKCHYCGSPMKTAKLICDNCESDSNKGKN